MGRDLEVVENHAIKKVEAGLMLQVTTRGSTPVAESRYVLHLY